VAKWRPTHPVSDAGAPDIDFERGYLEGYALGRNELRKDLAQAIKTRVDRYRELKWDHAAAALEELAGYGLMIAVDEGPEDE
jgi:hypothetical protein